MKSVLISIQPYWVFLIIARAMGWNILQKKTVEVRKDFPKASDWNKVVHIYCCKNRKSFNRIPKQYQPFMKKFLGKVMGEFVCDSIDEFLVFENKTVQYWNYHNLEKSCLTYDEIANYIGTNKKGYGWHISNLKIYDKPKELGAFRISRYCKEKDCENCKRKRGEYICDKRLTRTFQSWGYVDAL